MKLKLKLAAACLLGMALAIPATGGAWAAAPTDLEGKIQRLEQSLAELKAQLGERTAGRQKETAEAAKVAAVQTPAWLKRIKFYGDARMRFENTSYGSLHGKGKDSRSRFRVRLRFGAESSISDSLKVGMRMVTGQDNAPTSTNQTFGDYWGEKEFGIDRAYVIYTPVQLDKMLQLTMGKAKNPYYTSKAMWDGDVQPEGAFLKLAFNRAGAIKPFVLGSVMFVKEHKSDPPDDLYAYFAQAGAEAKFGKFKLLAATSYYDWGKLGEAGQIPPNVHGNVSWTNADGDERLSRFKVWDLYAKVSYKLADKTALGFWGHYLTNLDEDAASPYGGQDKGYAFGASLKYHKFMLTAWYKHVEANAAPGFAADSDSGYVNRKGFVLGADYKLFKYAVLKLTYFNTKPIEEDFPGAANDSQTMFVDMVFKF